MNVTANETGHAQPVSLPLGRGEGWVEGLGFREKGLGFRVV